MTLAHPRVLARGLLVVQLAALAVAVYAAVVVVLGRAVGRAPDDLVLQVLAATVLAVAFGPAQERAAALAYRVVHGARATPLQVLAEVTDQLGGAMSDAQALERLAALAAAGTGAVGATVWVRAGTRLRPAATWPSGRPVAAVAQLSGQSDPVLPCSDAVSVLRHGAEVVGALSVQTSLLGGLPASGQRLLDDLAAAAGMLLRRARLDAELADRVQTLRDSRRRLVAAQDSARRSLERDLHDGAQHQLVALKVGLGLARTLAAKDGHSMLATELAVLAVHADAAIEELRSVAHGIYPPLLTVEGLSAALLALGRRPAFPVTVSASGLRRHPEQVEATAYFAVDHLLSSLTDPGPAPVVVVAVEDAEELIVRVTSPGTDLDADPLIDRIEAVGGILTVDGRRVMVLLPLMTRAGP